MMCAAERAGFVCAGCGTSLRSTPPEGADTTLTSLETIWDEMVEPVSGSTTNWSAGASPATTPSPNPSDALTTNRFAPVTGSRVNRTPEASG